MKDITYYVALDNEEVIGSCFITIIPNLSKGIRAFGIIENVITDKKYRGKGIGKKLMNMAIEKAKKEKCYKVQLMSNVKRIDAHKFYEKIGFDGASKKGFEIRFN